MVHPSLSQLTLSSLCRAGTCLPKPACMVAGVDPNHTIAKSMEFINYTGFPYKLLLVSCDGCLENFVCQVLACKSGLKMPFSAFRALLLSLQTILLRDLVGCGLLLKITAVWRTFLKFKAHQKAVIVCSGILHLTK
jgi:hypothetical protein